MRSHPARGGQGRQVAVLSLVASSITGKLLGVNLAGKILRWPPGEMSLIGWLLQTKALIMIIFANILLDKDVITSETFTALLLMACREHHAYRAYGRAEARAHAA